MNFIYTYGTTTHSAIWTYSAVKKYLLDILC